MPQWQKGQSGNPKGRKPGPTPITDAIRKRLSKPKEVEALVELIFQRAKTDSSSTALNLLVERVDGKVKEQLEVEVNSFSQRAAQEVPALYGTEFFGFHTRVLPGGPVEVLTPEIAYPGNLAED